MAVLKIVLDDETNHRLEEDADAERRPPHLHAEVLIRRSLGLPFPYPRQAEAGRPAPLLRCGDEHVSAAS